MIGQLHQQARIQLIGIVARLIDQCLNLRYEGANFGCIGNHAETETGNAARNCVRSGAQ